MIARSKCINYTPNKKALQVHVLHLLYQFTQTNVIRVFAIVSRGGSRISSQGGAHIKKLHRAEGGTKIAGVFRVKNHDFTQKNDIFSNCGGRRENVWGISCDPPGSAPGVCCLFCICNLKLRLCCPIIHSLQTFPVHLSQTQI